ncbi:DUF5937 family protein [Microbacterium sp. MPKO10]|uniref:ArsR/SmtB family transcription factor n=1 Tax=Microbacterium sp. MPKO10 TaxID=2989818 RepID=UPI002236A57A|nr:DUF5937 family protein [Microbacterium sp. MPKO10]MCW4459852.1 DUF5937 family protein [Microbacterium sp. MPKO10]
MTWTLLAPKHVDDCVVRNSELAELGALLHAICFIDHHPSTHRLAASWFSKIDASLLAMIRAWAPVWGPYKARYMLPLSKDPHLSFDAEIEAIIQLPLAQFVKLTTHAILEGARLPAEVIDVDVHGPSLVARASRLSPLRGRLATQLFENPDESRRALINILTRVRSDTVIEHEFDMLMPSLAERGHAMRSELRSRGVSAIASVSSMATMSPDDARVVFDKQFHRVTRSDRGLLLMPSRHLDPHILIKGNDDFPTVVQYPPRNDEAVTLATVTQRFKAMQDPTRKKIIRGLMRQPQPPRELALALKMAEPQISRHLRALREAGIVVAEREGRMVRYHADLRVIQKLGSDFIETLIR